MTLTFSMLFFGERKIGLLVSRDSFPRSKICYSVSWEFLQPAKSPSHSLREFLQHGKPPLHILGGTFTRKTAVEYLEGIFSIPEGVSATNKNVLHCFEGIIAREKNVLPYSEGFYSLRKNTLTYSKENLKTFKDVFASFKEFFGGEKNALVTFT